ncbi:MAG: Hsp20/alpha crystallin family protein [Gallionella sp.]
MDNKRAEEFAEGKRRLDEINNKLGDLFGKSTGAAGGGLLAGLGNLVEQLGKLAEQQGGSGEIDFGSGSDKRMKGVYGFTVKSALGDRGGVKVEPFGNIKRDEAGKMVEVQAIREPMIDLFDEVDHLLMVAEVPGITEDAVRLELQDDILIFTAKQGDSQYRKEVLLPASFTAEQMSFTCRNGILEVRFNK